MMEAFKELKGSMNGFLVPHSGRVKKFILDFFSYFNIDEVTKKIKDDLDGDSLDNMQKSVLKDILENISKSNPTNFYSSDATYLNRIHIVKFEKKINKEDYTSPYYGPPKIISSGFPQDLTTTINMISGFYNIYNSGTIEIYKNNEDWELLEGDVINIKFPSSISALDELIYDYMFKKYLLISPF